MLIAKLLMLVWSTFFFFFFFIYFLLFFGPQLDNIFNIRVATRQPGDACCDRVVNICYITGVKFLLEAAID